jgi:uncharacterized protein (TIGR00730 family)
MPQKDPQMQCFSVCVYCGSRRGAKPIYAQEARALGTGHAERGWRQDYGAGDVGLMGNVARAAQAAGGETFGVIPTHLLQLEVGKQDLSSFIVTENMHERKKVMFMNCDAVVLMPGGAGSLDEFFEVLTWRQLELHSKPVIILNVAGYWDPLLKLAEHFIAEEFADPSMRDFYTVQTTATDVLAYLAALRAENPDQL